MQQQQQTTHENVNKEIQFNLAFHFPCSVYSLEIPNFLDSVNQVSEEYLQEAYNQQQVNDVYPVMMTRNYWDDPRLKDFCEFIGISSWNILNEQGYAMDHIGVTFDSMWTQEHHRQSSMEQHMHGHGVQLVGFYFLEVPKDSSTRVVFHDPRPAKIMVDLPQKDVRNITSASQMVNYEPKPGTLIISNSWLPHSFTRNSSYKPIKFVHFNIALTYNDQSQQVCPHNERTCVAPGAEVI